MNAVDFLTWGKEHNYPQLVLRQTFPCDILRPGERAWYGLVEDDNNERLQLAIARVEDFQNRYVAVEIEERSR